MTKTIRLALCSLLLSTFACSDDAQEPAACSDCGVCKDQSVADLFLPDQKIAPDASVPDIAPPDQLITLDNFIPDLTPPDLTPPDLMPPDITPPDIDPCGPGTTLCGGTCVNTTNDEAHCGACNSACKTGEVCSASKCLFTCPASQTKCTGSGGKAYCASTASDNQNCGTCGKACAATEACSSGLCLFTCPSTQTKCTDSGGKAYCANTATDNQNCGSCGNACAPTEACSAGGCLFTCPVGQTKCKDSAGKFFCANTGSDNKNCGACGTVCQANAVCTSGVCIPVCFTGETLCTPTAGAPYCAILTTDVKNCGACGNVCGAGGTCEAGVCKAPSCNGLNGYWQLEEMTGATAGDSVGANHGAAVNGPIWESGLLGGALRFSGSNYVRVKDSSTLDPGTGDFSIQAWIKIPVGQKAQRRVVAHGTHGAGGHDGFALMQWCGWGTVPCGGVALLMGQDSKGEVMVGTCAAMDDGKWHHYAASVNRKGSITFYVDGAALTTFCHGTYVGGAWGNNTPGDVSNQSTVDLNSACDLCLGTSCQSSGNCSGSSEYFVGSVDQVAYYKRTLTAAEVAGSYNTGLGLELCQPTAATASGCADGTREGLVSQLAFPKIAACAGSWTGDVSNAAPLCASGWTPCLGADPSVKKVFYPQAKLFAGCFAFDAAHDNHKCHSDCSAAVANGIDTATGIDMGGMGAGCTYGNAAWASCLGSGRVDASTNSGTGCNYYSGLKGVICCGK